MRAVGLRFNKSFGFDAKGSLHALAEPSGPVEAQPRSN
jgi:hypothetical protein